MLLFNIILVVVVLGFIGAGAKDGFIKSLGRLVGAVLGFIAAKKWYLILAAPLSIGMPYGWAKILSFVIVFLVAARLIGFVFGLAENAFKILSIIPFLKTINNVAGAIFGLAEGIVIMGGIIYLIKVFNVDPTVAKYLSGSTIAGWIQHVFEALLAFLL